MVLNLRTLMLGLPLIVVSACNPAQRSCEPFSHPDELIWDPAVTGDVLVFVNQMGDEIRYELKRTVSDGASTVNEGQACRTFSVSEYFDDVNNIGFDVTLRYVVAVNFDNSEPTPVEQLSLGYDVEPVKPDVFTNTGARFSLGDLEDPLNNGVRGNSVYQYYPMLTVNGIEYPDVLSRDGSASQEVAEFLSDYPDDVAWTRVLVARDVGLLQYELLNGEIYTRQPD